MATINDVLMDGVRGGETSVFLAQDFATGRLVIRGYNQSGYDSVEIDLLDMLQWLFKNGFIPFDDEATLLARAIAASGGGSGSGANEAMKGAGRTIDWKSVVFADGASIVGGCGAGGSKLGKGQR